MLGSADTEEVGRAGWKVCTTAHHSSPVLDSDQLQGFPECRRGNLVDSPEERLLLQRVSAFPCSPGNETMEPSPFLFLSAYFHISSCALNLVPLTAIFTTSEQTWLVSDGLPWSSNPIRAMGAVVFKSSCHLPSVNTFFFFFLNKIFLLATIKKWVCNPRHSLRREHYIFDLLLCLEMMILAPVSFPWTPACMLDHSHIWSLEPGNLGSNPCLAIL